MKNKLKSRQPWADAIKTSILAATVFTAVIVCGIGCFMAWFFSMPFYCMEMALRRK